MTHAAPQAISVGQFRQFEFYIEITTLDTAGFVLTSRATAAGWNGTDLLAATVRVTDTGRLGAPNTSAYAFDTGASLPAGSPPPHLIIEPGGYIVGAGGPGGQGVDSVGAGSHAGGNGGPALRAQYPILITRRGPIGGGGGGGGGGTGGYTYNSAGSGGGGAGAIVGPGGPARYGEPGGPGGAGSPGTLTTGGAGGTSSEGGGSRTGGTGGALGQPGTGSAPGAAGAAVVGNSYITWLETSGPILGGVS